MFRGLFLSCLFTDLFLTFRIYVDHVALVFLCLTYFAQRNIICADADSMVSGTSTAES